MSEPVFIIAEAGVNHNGRLDLAHQLIIEAAGSGADAVKFQAFKAEKVISRYAEKAEYQKNTTGLHETQLEMAKRLELPYDVFPELQEHCKRKNIEFISSAFDEDSLDLLLKMGVETLKIASGEITNLPLLRKFGKSRKNIILSTGMAKLDEIESAIKVLIICGTQKENIAVLHCNTEYPTPAADVNLKAMHHLREHLGFVVGYSDHTLGTEIPIAAVALGATIIEKHLTLDRNLEGPDQSASIEPHELKKMILEIRNVEVALGNGMKGVSPSELKNREIVRRSIVAKKTILRGEIFSEENITTKRPGQGLSPMMWDSIIGERAKSNFEEDEFIKL